ncbi:hypothetical protein WICPIJ_005301 [Wickerhamomyces pijperi]|uniref:Alpha-1,3/1,6-mannosyltransferase ALG2 n=1 Tax=Wickerhamomyces pijperi TaxID=599730 RepID=A0A9P8Q696_WICPI|nr:hypothetical protein WICPIJ_005301 [Wickerhamomyces pijperi]
MRVAFIHPDLGIGGAERLIVDAAKGLQDEGHNVTIFTSHCDKSHCFEEIKQDALKVEVIGDWLPTHFQGKFKILFAILRQLCLVWHLIWYGKVRQFDFFIVDQLSVCLPLLHLFANHSARILFYCHFPDLKLADHSSFIRSLYRLPFDIIEQFSMSAADGIVVNSNFTKSVYEETFTLLKELIKPDVVYPCVSLEKEVISNSTKTIFDKFISDKPFLLSINRFEPKKNIELAIESYHSFRTTSDHLKSETLKLVLTGGYDPNSQMNKEYLADLTLKCQILGLKLLKVLPDEYESVKCEAYDVLFLPSISSNLKELLLSESEMLLYTPSFEHFGIVPVEAMKFGTPIIAVDNGGPKESIISLGDKKDQGFGLLLAAEPELWDKGIRTVLDSNKRQISSNAQSRLESLFTEKAMIASFEKQMIKLLKSPRRFYIWERITGFWKIPIILILHYVFDLNSKYLTVMLIISAMPIDIFSIILSCIMTYLYFYKYEWFQDIENMKRDVSKAFAGEI